MRVLVIFGTRPEAIKMIPVIKSLAEKPDILVKVLVTGQHREMLDQVMELFSIQADYDLDLMGKVGSLTSTTASAMSGIESVMKALRPDVVLVHGDTSTTLAAALAAYHEKIAVGHVEAGLRTGNIYAPWPEEINRKCVSAIASLHFAPTEQSQSNLVAEGVQASSIFVTGNTVIDALFYAKAALDRDDALTSELSARFGIDPSKKLILVTGHRRENQGEGLDNVCRALTNLALGSEVQIIFPVHMSPAVSGPVRAMLDGCRGINLVEPQDYLSFVFLMTAASLIITDSGGIQEEAPSMHTPVLVTRETTERPEALETGLVELVGTEASKIVATANKWLNSGETLRALRHTKNPYGDGAAAHRITDALLGWWAAPQDY